LPGLLLVATDSGRERGVSEPKTLGEIGQRLGVSRERVRQLVTEALKRLAGLPEAEWVGR